MSERDETVTCGNEGCGRPAEDGSRFCASCGLEWMLLRRDARREAPADRMPR